MGEENNKFWQILGSLGLPQILAAIGVREIAKFIPSTTPKPQKADAVKLNKEIRSI